MGMCTGRQLDMGERRRRRGSPGEQKLSAPTFQTGLQTQATLLTRRPEPWRISPTPRFVFAENSEPAFGWFGALPANLESRNLS